MGTYHCNQTFLSYLHTNKTPENDNLPVTVTIPLSPSWLDSLAEPATKFPIKRGLHRIWSLEIRTNQTRQMGSHEHPLI